jgi:ssDNA-binding Zn-finger/Zn-ribbon topoisomerase 1
MATGKKAAKLAIRTDRDAGKSKICPSCGNPKMSIVKMVRSTRPSGIFWFCDKCDHEEATR